MPRQRSRGDGAKKPKHSFRDWKCFLPLLRPHRTALLAAIVAMILDAAFTVMRPWPLKVVIDRVLSHRPSRVPFIRAWLDASVHNPMHILWGACAATFLIALGPASLPTFLPGRSATLGSTLLSTCGAIFLPICSACRFVSMIASRLAICLPG